MNFMSIFKSSFLKNVFSFSRVRQAITKNDRPGIQEILKQYSQQLQSSKIIEQMIPKSFDEFNLLGLSKNQRFSLGQNHVNSLTKGLSQPIWDLLSRGGKRWRPVLCMIIAQMFDRKRSEVYQIAALCQIIHNGTLMIDDIEDCSQVRRNKPSVHLLYGVDIAINAGNFMYYAPMLKLLKLKKYRPEILLKLNQIYMEQMVQLHIGQGWDIVWHNIEKLNNQYPTQNQYLQMTAHKTGVLARLSCRMVCAALEINQIQTQILIKFVQNLGVAFQIQDDLLNLEGEQFKSTKGYFGQDIHEGKLTLIIIHYLQTGVYKDRLIEILRKKTQNEAQIAQAITLLKNNNSLNYARQKMFKIVDETIGTLDNHFTESQSLRLLKQLCEFGITRQK